VKVCLVTTGQPSTNPRLVKEADALVEMGCDVDVVAAHWTDWATALDGDLLATRKWRLSFIDWRREQAPGLFYWSRARHWAARRALVRPSVSSRLTAGALSRVGPELVDRAVRRPADLYIAHNLGALPAADAAAHANHAAMAFDAEDFHSGQIADAMNGGFREYLQAVERHFLPRCAYVTAASPGIAEAYESLCHIPKPTVVLNVFPLRDRPTRFRSMAPEAPVRLYWFSQTIGPDRGLEDAVRAMGQLRDLPIELHLRGRWHPGYESSLRQLAAETGVLQTQIISHAPEAADDMVRLAAEFDIGLALEPPLSENNNILLSNKIFVYLLAGAAVLATRTQGQRRLLPELQCAAQSSEPGDPIALAAVLRRWVEDRHALNRARDAAWQLGETRFNWDREKTTFCDVVRRVALN
jgi:glycosyltransferase involved in cell wall biosynthesis